MDFETILRDHEPEVTGYDGEIDSCGCGEWDKPYIPYGQPGHQRDGQHYRDHIVDVLKKAQEG